MSDVKDYDELPQNQEPDPDEEARVRERAYLIWEQEGRPEGRAMGHWLRAQREHRSSRREMIRKADESSSLD